MKLRVRLSSIHHGRGCDFESNDGWLANEGVEESAERKGGTVKCESSEEDEEPDVKVKVEEACEDEDESGRSIEGEERDSDGEDVKSEP